CVLNEMCIHSYGALATVEGPQPMESNHRVTVARSVRAVAGGLAFLCLAAAIVGPRWAPNIVVLSKDRLLAGIVGVVLAAAALLGANFGRAYKGASLILLNTLLLLCILELGSSVASMFGENNKAQKVRNTRLAAQPFQQQHDVDFWNAMTAKQLEPYVLW